MVWESGERVIGKGKKNCRHAVMGKAKPKAFTAKGATVAKEREQNPQARRQSTPVCNTIRERGRKPGIG
jgi:hypothetical protein